MRRTMIRSAARRACSLMVALVLLLAPHLGCHHARALPCHGGGSSNAIRSACSHAPEPATPSGGMRGAIPAAVRLRPVFTARSAPAHARVLVTQHMPEPSTDPPRLIA